MIKDLIVFGLIWPSLVMASMYFASTQQPMNAHFIGFSTALVLMVHAYIVAHTRRGSK